VAVSVHVATTLDFAGSLGSVELSAVDQGDGTELVTTRSAVSYLVEATQFLRVEATLP
jgi:hypothetical protein